MISQDLFVSKTNKNRTTKPMTLPDGTETHNCSKDYMVYCEALNLSKKTLAFRQTFLKKIDKPQQQERVNKLKYWLTFIWNKKCD
jgi:hypothetical protein